MTSQEKIYSETEQRMRYESIANEWSYIESGIQRTQDSIYQAFGIVLPASITAFGLILTKNDNVDIRNVVPLVFIVLVSATIMWTCSLWMELLRYYRYKYVSLLPELYAVSFREGQRNMMVFQSGQGNSSLMPALLLNVSMLIFLIGLVVIFYGIPIVKVPYLFFGLAFVSLTIVAIVYVLWEFKDVQRAACRAHNLRSH